MTCTYGLGPAKGTRSRSPPPPTRAIEGKTQTPQLRHTQRREAGDMSSERPARPVASNKRRADNSAPGTSCEATTAGLHDVVVAMKSQLESL